jgi:hypothetical protein
MGLIPRVWTVTGSSTTTIRIDDDFIPEPLIRVLCPEYHGAGYDSTNLDMILFPPVANGWETKYPVLDMVPPLMAKGERRPTENELNLDTVHISAFIHPRWQAGRHDFTTCQLDVTPP